MRSFTSMSSSSSFRARGRGARWHRSYSDRAAAPHQQRPPLTEGAPDASSGSRTRNPRPSGARGPRPYTGYYAPPAPHHGRGPAYSVGPSPQEFQPSSSHFLGPPAPGPGYGLRPPTQFRGRGPPHPVPQPPVNMQQYYNQQPPPHWYYTPNVTQGATHAPRYNGMRQQPGVPDKLKSYRRKWRLPPSPVPLHFGKMND